MAAVTLQRAWRRYSQRSTFAYYKALIDLKEGCDPREVLRCINPREAGLVDAAAGVHVRFRLGGACFPPILLYKIFTHRPVTDIGAFAPRNYSAEAVFPGQPPVRPAICAHSLSACWPCGTRSSGSQSKRDNSSEAACSSGHGECALLLVRSSGSVAKHAPAETALPDSVRKFVRADGRIGHRTRYGWYQRVENNGWRPVDEVAMALEDGLSKLKHGTGAKPVSDAFHHSSRARKQLREIQNKERRRKWLMATQGLREQDSAVLCQPPKDTGGGAEDMTEDALLQWCSALDFDAYAAAWAVTATTLGSDSLIPILEYSSLPEIPPCMPATVVVHA